MDTTEVVKSVAASNLDGQLGDFPGDTQSLVTLVKTVTLHCVSEQGCELAMGGDPFIAKKTAEALGEIRVTPLFAPPQSASPIIPARAFPYLAEKYGEFCLSGKFCVEVFLKACGKMEEHRKSCLDSVLPALWDVPDEELLGVKNICCAVRNKYWSEVPVALGLLDAAIEFRTERHLH